MRRDVHFARRDAVRACVGGRVSPLHEPKGHSRLQQRRHDDRNLAIGEARECSANRLHVSSPAPSRIETHKAPCVMVRDRRASRCPQHRPILRDASSTEKRSQRGALKFPWSPAACSSREARAAPGDERPTPDAHPARQHDGFPRCLARARATNGKQGHDVQGSGGGADAVPAEVSMTRRDQGRRRSTTARCVWCREGTRLTPSPCVAHA